MATAALALSWSLTYIDSVSALTAAELTQRSGRAVVPVVRFQPKKVWGFFSKCQEFKVFWRFLNAGKSFIRVGLLATAAEFEKR